MSSIFDQIIDRHNVHSVKWEVQPGELPMWVADTDFAVPPEVQAALQRRAAHPTFGYNTIPRDYFEAYSQWWQTRHHLAATLANPTDMVFVTGVVPAISSIVRSATTVGDSVIVMPPVYNIFYNSIRNNHRQVLECPLREISERTPETDCANPASSTNPTTKWEGSLTKWEIDFDLLEQQAAKPTTALLILCNPQNPTGTIWTRQELAQIGQICARHQVTVIADEIHCDLTLPGKNYVPFRAVSPECAEISITCWSPSKTFNLAGLNSSVMVVSNPKLRRVVERGVNTDEVAEAGSFAIDAPIAAYQHGAGWVDELRAYIHANKQLATEEINRELASSGVTTSVSDSTYLQWIDCRQLGHNLGLAPEKVSQTLVESIRKKTGLILSAGSVYGQGGAGFLRMNLGTSRARVEDGVQRLIRALHFDPS